VPIGNSYWGKEKEEGMAYWVGAVEEERRDREMKGM